MRIPKRALVVGGVLVACGLVAGWYYRGDKLSGSLSALTGSEAKEVVILSSPSGAQVRIDGQVIGRTPYLGNNIFGPGRHRVEITQRGYRAWTRDQEFTLENSRIDARLVRATAREAKARGRRAPDAVIDKPVVTTASPPPQPTEVKAAPQDPREEQALERKLLQEKTDQEGQVIDSEADEEMERMGEEP